MVNRQQARHAKALFLQNSGRILSQARPPLSPDTAHIRLSSPARRFSARKDGRLSGIGVFPSGLATRPQGHPSATLASVADRINSLA